jgi:uncharacterized protein
MCAVLFASLADRSASGGGPSFDCARAGAPVEHLICGNDRLAAQDVELSSAFRESREGQDEAARTLLLQGQRRWLQSRLSSCGIPVQGEMPPERLPAAATCLSELYGARISALKARPAAVSVGPAVSPTSAPNIETPSVPQAATVNAPAAAKFDKTLFAAKGDNETLMTIGEFGRYAIAVKSEQGTAVQLIDRMAGPGSVDGSAGHSDGRVDAFLDRGQYKVRLFSDPRGSGDAELSIVPSVELNPAPQQLVELKPIAADLGDHEQRSYWLDIKERRFVAIEAAGRYLTDMRLWKDGNWLVDATPEAGGRDPKGGEPLAIRQLALWLEPGLYRLIAYGGLGEKWSSGSTGKPLYLRYGIPKLPDAGRAMQEASPFGVDRWRVPNASTFFRIDIDHAEHAALSVNAYDPERPFATGGERATIEKDSRDPKAEVRTSAPGANKEWLVTVERTPGAKYRLQYFDDRRERALSVSGPSDTYWLAALQAGNAGDALDPTAIVVRDNREVVAASAIQLDPAKGWRRKFNLIAPVTLFLQASQPIELAVDGSGADAEYRIEPFQIARPADYRTPATKLSGGVWPIGPGYWVLSVYPRENGKGVLDMTLRPAKVVGDQAEQTRLAAPVFPAVAFERKRPYTLFLNTTGESYGGADLHKLPLDLSEGVSFQLVGGAALTIPVTVKAAGRLAARTEDGNAVPMTIDGKALATAATLDPGAHTVALTAPGDQPVYISLNFTPETLLQSTPLPPVDPARLAQRPQFPVLSAAAPIFLDLAHNQKATFNVTVDKPALYRLESSGIIETAGAIRTRTVTSLDDATANGIGRNFVIQQYLREGDYQLTAQPAGESFGAIGLALTSTQVADFGLLEPELWARATLSPGQAGRYRFHIAEAGQYRLHTLGLHHEFAMRLEDDGGWPLLKPGSTADATIRLDAGDYQMVLLPQPVESRAVTLLHRIETPAELSGHGPFALTLAQAARNRWMEPEKGTPRTPDRWNFTLPAAAEVTITTDNGMQETLVQAGKPTDKVTLAERPWTGTLEAGDYGIETVSAAPNSRVDYSLTVATTEMLAGQKRSVTAPAKLPVSIGADRQVEFASFGGEDAKASLYDADGKLVASNDDRENDWNFLIPARLRPGRYELHVDPVGSESLSTEVAFIQPDEIQDPTPAFAKPVTVSDGRIHVMTIGDSPAGALIVLTAHAGTPVGLSIEGMDADKSWRTLGSTSGRDPYLALPRGPDGKRALRVRVWSVDHAHLPIEFAVTATSPATGTEAVLSGRGIALTPIDGGAVDLAAALVTLDQPGAFQLGNDAESVQWAVGSDAAASRNQAGSVIAPGPSLWLIDRADRKHTHSISARRVDPNGPDPVHLVVKAGEPIILPIQPSGKDGGIALWRVEGQGGQPGIALGELGAAPAALVPLMAAGIDSPTLGSAVAITPGSLTKPVVRIWNASGSGQEMPVTLRRIPFGPPKTITLQPGITDGGFGGREAQILALPPGMKRLTLVLPADTVAVPMKGDVPEQMIWAVSSHAEIVETSAERLLLLHSMAEKSPFSITVEPVADKASLALSSGAILSRYTPTPGILHFNIDPAAPVDAMLRIAGSAKGATAIGPDGIVRRGSEIGTLPGSLVSVEYQPGLFALGLDSTSSAGRNAEQPVAVVPPAMVPLAGARMNLSIAGGAPRLVHVASDTPIVLRAMSGERTAGRTLFGAGADLNLVLAQGQAGRLEIEPAGVAALSGAAHLTAIELTPIGEGIGPKRRLAPGQSRAFSFTLTDARTIGVGVRASVDIATCRLLRDDGTEIGQGLVHMHDLKAGGYVLVVDAPSDGPAIDIEPALVGTVIPDKGPPDAVKADYLALVGKQAKK